MFFSESFINELLLRTTVSEVVKWKGVSLKAKSAGEYLGLCPFHQENTPSFTVSDHKNFYHCFGCSAHGSAISFLMQLDKLPYPDAVKELANYVGMELPTQNPLELKKQKEKRSLYDVMELACNWYQENLNLDVGLDALSYLKRRNINQHTIEKFKIGFAPAQSGALMKYLKGKGVSEQNMLDVGLVKKSQSGDIYEYFRGRIIFPISDTKGSVIAFGGRIMGDGQPKYLNSPETSIFKKGFNLYNENLAKASAYKNGTIIVAEGYVDVIAFDRMGVEYAVAPLGTALTQDQLLRLWKIAKEPIICLDGDTAGQNAMYRIINLCFNGLRPGYSLRFAIMPEGMDPDDLVNSGQQEAVHKILGNTISLADALWQMEQSKASLDTPESRADLAKKLYSYSEKIQDKTLKLFYNRYFSNKLYAIGINTKKAKSKELPQIPDGHHLTQIDINTTLGCEKMLTCLVFSNVTILENEGVKENYLNIDFIDKSHRLIQVAILQFVEDESEELCTKSLRSFLISSDMAGEVKNLETISTKIDCLNNIGDSWSYHYLKYQANRLKDEYRQTIAQMDEASMVKASLIKKELDAKEQEILHYEQNLAV